MLEGYFLTPLEKYLPGIVPQIAQKAHFQILLPEQWPDTRCKPVCLHLAGTGDHVRNSLNILIYNVHYVYHCTHFIKKFYKE